MAEKASSSSSSRSRGASIVVDHGRCRSSCGYCKSVGFTSISHGLLAHSITVDDYQDLLDQGWRRSGSFLYKPEMESTCCPSYTIRLKASNFVPSKEQARVSRRMQRFLDGSFDGKRLNDGEDEPNSSVTLGSLCNDTSSAMDLDSTANESSASDYVEKYKSEEYIHYLSNEIDRAVSACLERDEFPSSVQLPRATVKKVTPQAKKRRIESSGELLYTSSISFQIAAALRRLQSVENNVQQSGLCRNGETQNVQPSEHSPQVVAEKLACSLDKQVELPGLWIKACNGHLNFYTSTNETASGEVPVNITTSTESSRSGGANAKWSGIVNNSALTPHKRRRLEIRLRRSSFDVEEYALYRKYQIRVHNDKPDQVTRSSYIRFLVDSPLIFIPPSGDNTVPPCGFGSFHQQYLIDGKLVAVGVVDILPRCLSSKYLFWDPDLAFLSLGKYSALQEINWVRETEGHCPSLQYYYLGYYIHSCSKMRYKAAYRPSELLCPLRYQWVAFDIARPLLDKKPYVVLSDYVTLQNGSSSLGMIPENSVIQPPFLECSQEGQSEAFSHEDEEMEPDFEEMEPDFKSPDAGPGHDPSPEISSAASAEEVKVDDVSNVVIDLHGALLKFKDLRRALRPGETRHIDLLEMQLRKYVRVVGPKLSGRLVYSLS